MTKAEKLLKTAQDIFGDIVVEVIGDADVLDDGSIDFSVEEVGDNGIILRFINNHTVKLRTSEWAWIEKQQ